MTFMIVASPCAVVLATHAAHYWPQSLQRGVCCEP